MFVICVLAVKLVKFLFVRIQITCLGMLLYTIKFFMCRWILVIVQLSQRWLKQLKLISMIALKKSNDIGEVVLWAQSLLQELPRLKRLKQENLHKNKVE